MATPSTATADATSSQTSKEFPPGYGDFTLVSKDGTYFSFPSFLLIHSSGFFRDMFDTAGETPNTTKQLTAFNVEQDQEVFDQFLRRLDPVKAKVHLNYLDAPTTVGLLEAARFYRVPFIFKSFEDEVYSPGFSAGGLKNETFVENHPFLTLGLAFQLGLDKGVQRAMQELTHCHISMWTSGVDVPVVDIPSPLLQLCRKLRDERANVYRALVESLADYDRSNSGNIKISTPTVCIHCVVRRSQWIHKLFTVAVDHPKWAVFYTAYNDPTECATCKVCWSKDKTPTLLRWKRRLSPEALESKLPELPEWLQAQLERNAETIS